MRTPLYLAGFALVCLVGGFGVAALADALDVTGPAETVMIAAWVGVVIVTAEGLRRRFES